MRKLLIARQAERLWGGRCGAAQAVNRPVAIAAQRLAPQADIHPVRSTAYANATKNLEVVAGDGGVDPLPWRQRRCRSAKKRLVAEASGTESRPMPAAIQSDSAVDCWREDAEAGRSDWSIVDCRRGVCRYLLPRRRHAVRLVGGANPRWDDSRGLAGRVYLHPILRAAWPPRSRPSGP